jgi:hypothetical protein
MQLGALSMMAGMPLLRSVEIHAAGGEAALLA